jgi:hypothetical protein
MRSILIFCWICISRFAGYSTENPTVLIAKADSLSASCNYAEALITYERAGFLANDNITKTNALLHKAQCFWMKKQFKDAQKTLNRINFSGLEDSMIFVSRYYTALSAYLIADFEGAESQLLQLNYFLKDSTLRIKSLYLYALVLNETQHWEDAKTKLYEWINSSGKLSLIEKDSLLQFVSESYDPKNIPKLINPEKAKTLSMFLPGTGQWYAGFFGEGALSMSLQLAGLGFTAFSVYSGYYVTAFVIGYSFFQRFYSGGIKRAEFLANKKNNIRIRKFNDKARKEILLLDKKLNKW